MESDKGCIGNLSESVAEFQLVCREKVRKVYDENDLVNLANQIQQSDSKVKMSVNTKLQVILEQMNNLKEQAFRILEEAKRDTDLNHAECNLIKKPGNIYYVYRRADNKTFLSIVSPTEWGSSNPHKYVGAYRYEYDSSWTPIDKISQADETRDKIDRIINDKLSITAEGFNQ
ncbi:DgyrCDS7930 [Dimorphilus gyrociliatus]|uniref:DgyrCDS7930 n=1 Tax=Dimorphilus gyrociliatus TaxID=2664684 RepID=A0A7I8VSL7_9ANNE|nr:DgyrCDS7930 [Dimorphilus gyrociliatus]